MKATKVGKTWIVDTGPRVVMRRCATRSDAEKALVEITRKAPGHYEIEECKEPFAIVLKQNGGRGGS